MVNTNGLKRTLIHGVERTIGTWMSNPDRVVVLCYHSVGVDTPGSTDRALFGDHLAWLRENCSLIAFRDVLGETLGPKGSKPRVAITFDDGYADNHSLALPVLASQNMSATFFLTVGFVERQPEVLKRFAELGADGAAPLEPLTWSQVSEMKSVGMDFGSHTWGHPNLATQDSEAVLRELQVSKRALEDHLGQAVTHFAYPFGKPKRHFNRKTMELVARAGYEYAAAVLYRKVRRSDSPFAIPRFFITGDAIEELEAKVMGKRDLQGLWQEHLPLWAARVVSPRDLAV